MGRRHSPPASQPDSCVSVGRIGKTGRAARYIKARAIAHAGLCEKVLMKRTCEIAFDSADECANRHRLPEKCGPSWMSYVDSSSSDDESRTHSRMHVPVGAIVGGCGSETSSTCSQATRDCPPKTTSAATTLMGVSPATQNTNTQCSWLQPYVNSYAQWAPCIREQARVECGKRAMEVVGAVVRGG